MKKFGTIATVMAIVASMAVFGACGEQPATDGKPVDGGSTLSGSITVTGSDTMLQLSTVFAEEFMKANPGVSITVNGGGSGVGITQLMEGTTDLANSSRDIKDKERDDAKSKGMTIEDVAVAYDGIAIVVNPANPIGEISMDQLARIFTGEITSWKDLGGEDKPIVVLSRENTSGTFAFFQEHVLKKKDFRKDAQFLAATSPIIQTASTDKYAIGYAGLGYAVEAGSSVKIVNVKKDDSSTAFAPSEATIHSGEYPISRALFVAGISEKKSELTKAFFDFMTGGAGQAIVRELGFITLKK